mmetsp:Transcript_15151/g.34509  ORF Transcript_15151/g.34509 Transcript_15151/m.34509 type:complete len:221 (+) Transcript_15151:1109-1771(+)
MNFWQIRLCLAVGSASSCRSSSPASMSIFCLAVGAFSKASTLLMPAASTPSTAAPLRGTMLQLGGAPPMPSAPKVNTSPLPFGPIDLWAEAPMDKVSSASLPNNASDKALRSISTRNTSCAPSRSKTIAFPAPLRSKSWRICRNTCTVSSALKIAKSLAACPAFMCSRRNAALTPTPLTGRGPSAGESLHKKRTTAIRSSCCVLGQARLSVASSLRLREG